MRVSTTNSYRGREITRYDGPAEIRGWRLDSGIQIKVSGTNGIQYTVGIDRETLDKLNAEAERLKNEPGINF